MVRSISKSEKPEWRGECEQSVISLEDRRESRKNRPKLLQLWFFIKEKVRSFAIPSLSFPRMKPWPPFVGPPFTPSDPDVFA
jgi:hypothetical protein